MNAQAQQQIGIGPKGINVDTGNGWQELAIVAALMVLAVLLYLAVKNFDRKMPP